MEPPAKRGLAHVCDVIRKDLHDWMKPRSTKLRRKQNKQLKLGFF